MEDIFEPIKPKYSSDHDGPIYYRFKLCIKFILKLISTNTNEFNQEFEGSKEGELKIEDKNLRLVGLSVCID